MINLKLPEIIITEENISLLYGANTIVKQYCNLNFIPFDIKGSWVHGCSFPWLRKYPENIILGSTDNYDNLNFVATKEDETFLIKNGYKALAIGLPICYLNQVNYARISNSLLIMPAHSTHYVSVDAIKSNDYIDFIESISTPFDLINVCLHQECVIRGIWINEFKKINIQYIVGANAYDLNSLQRIKALMSQFEFVTSNVIGSHIPYAAAFGAKVSISGPYFKNSHDMFLNDPFFKRRPHLIEYYLDQESNVRNHYPFLFKQSPKDAKQNIEWGLEMIGYYNKVQPSAMINLFSLGLYYDTLLRFKSKVIKYKNKYFKSESMFNK
jgi:hypothetical protein